MLENFTERGRATGSGKPRTKIAIVLDVRGYFRLDKPTEPRFYCCLAKEDNAHRKACTSIN